MQQFIIFTNRTQTFLQTKLTLQRREVAAHIRGDLGFPTIQNLCSRGISGSKIAGVVHMEHAISGGKNEKARQPKTTFLYVQV